VASGPEAGLDAGGEVGVAEALDHLLPGDQRVGPVLESERHEREPEQGDGAEPEQMGRAVQHPLQRDGDPPLDLLGRLAGEQGDDLDLGVGGIGESLDGEVVVGINAAGGDHDRQQHGAQAVSQRAAE